MIRCPVRSLHAHRGASTSSVTTRTTRVDCACRWPSTGASRSRVTPHPAWCGSRVSPSRERPSSRSTSQIRRASSRRGLGTSPLSSLGCGRRTGSRARSSRRCPQGSVCRRARRFEVAVALAIGADGGDPVALARLCQAAEHAARGVPTGILDQISSICGLAGHALLLDCHAVAVTPVPLPPPEVAEWVVLVPSRHAGPRHIGLQRAGRRARARRGRGRAAATRHPR